MAAFGDLFNEPGMTLRNPSQDEEGCPGLVAGEEIQHLAGVWSDSTFK